MVRKLALSLVAVSLLGAPAFASAKVAPPAKSMQSTAATRAVAKKSVATKPVAAAKASASAPRKRHVRRLVRHHRHAVIAKQRPATRT